LFCIYLENSHHENRINPLLSGKLSISIQFLIVFAFIWKSQDKKIELFGFWAQNHTFSFDSISDCICIYLENSKHENRLNPLKRDKSLIVNSISDCICIYLEKSKQKNRINRFMGQKSINFNSISHCLCIYFENSNQKLS
jgi:hypothetical protein